MGSLEGGSLNKDATLLDCHLRHAQLFSSLAVLPEDRHQLFDLLVTVFGTAALYRLADAGSDVLLQDDLADFVECTRRGGQLHQDIDAVFLILDHTTNRFDLSDDTSKSVVELFFLVV